MISKFIILALILHVFALDQVSEIVHADPIDNFCYNYTSDFDEDDQRQVHYLLWTRNNTGNNNDYKVIPFNSASLASSPYSSSKKTYMIIHGYNTNGKTEWVLDIKSKILSIEDANVFSLDYGGLVNGTYLISVCNGYKVANYTAYVLNWIHNQAGLDSSRLHLAGHSLGAHVAGITGYYLKYDAKLNAGIVSRITGLDPAGPLFTPNDFRLDKDKANYVDIIHSDSIRFGNNDRLGHVDFWPNGGANQPGCDFVGCSHFRSFEYYIESIVPINQTFKSWPCGSWADFEAGNCQSCGEGCVEMGFHVATNLQPRQMFYLKTNAQSPYAKGDSQN